MTQVSKQEYTVFTEYGYLDAANCGHLPLREAIESIARHNVPVAWSPESTNIYAGTKHYDVLLEESIAAGRLIENIDGQWVARGVEEEKVTAFIDGVFYQFGADTVEVFTQDYLLDPNAAMIARDGEGFARAMPTPPAAVVLQAPVSTTKPNPFASFRNPDSCNGPADHLNAARHQMAGMSKS